jgi:predicted nucleotidyltransferase
MSTPLPNDIAGALFGKTRLMILSLLFTRPGEAFYVREMTRMAGNQGAVQRELANLASAGLLERFSKGNLVFYKANESSPIFPELKSLFVKTTGIVDVLRESLSPLRARIKLAFIFGSFAAGEEKPDSDIDLMLIGSLKLAEAVAALQGAQEMLGREINPSVYPAAEFKRKLSAGHHFVRAVCEGPVLMVLGDEDELRRLGEKGLAAQTRANGPGDSSTARNRRA